MSVANCFYAKNIKYLEETKTVYVLDEHGSRLTFSYTFCCKISTGMANIHTFFDFKRNRCLVAVSSADRGDGYARSYQCVDMGFTVIDDVPLFSTRYWSDMETIVNLMSVEFKEKYASYTLDSIINS